MAPFQLKAYFWHTLCEDPGDVLVGAGGSRRASPKLAHLCLAPAQLHQEGHAGQCAQTRAHAQHTEVTLSKLLVWGHSNEEGGRDSGISRKQLSRHRATSQRLWRNERHTDPVGSVSGSWGLSARYSNESLKGEHLWWDAQMGGESEGG